ncbi:hypothetical protein WIW50_05355 [Flavobacteriaceae bacterium 3-367]|uniref:hypothetical protein n=1 Tax=Eudoraea algarum TaxID=3417568 RepID=UPI00326DD742
MMTPQINKKLLKQHDLPIGSFYFYENFVVSEIKEGVTMTFETASKIFELGKTYFGNTTPFVYISNRVNSYAFDPTAHFKSTAMFPNLKGYAVVVYDTINDKVAKMEQPFMNKPAHIFKRLQDAIDWVEELIPQD